MSKTITPELLNAWTGAYERSPERRLAALALSKGELMQAAFSQEEANRMHQRFSLEVKTMDVANQEASGRCWLFAATNVLREAIGR